MTEMYIIYNCKNKHLKDILVITYWCFTAASSESGRTSTSEYVVDHNTTAAVTARAG